MSYINQTKEAAVATANEMLEELGLNPLNESEVKDWGIVGGETNSQLQEWVNDYASDLHTEKCAASNEWRYS